MKIAIISNDFIDEGFVGGGVQVVKQLVPHFLKMNYDIRIFTRTLQNIYERHNKPFESTSKTNFALERIVERIDCTPNKFNYMSPKIFNNKLRSFAPDIVHCFSADVLSLWAIKEAKRHNLPTIYTHQGRTNYLLEMMTPFSRDNIIHKIIAFKKKSCMRSISNNAMYLTAVSDSAKNDLEQFLNKPYKEIAIVRNGFDYNRFRNLSDVVDSWETTYDSFKCIYVGRLSKEKNIEQSLQIIKELVKRKLNVIFNVVGDGDYENELREEAKKMDINKNVNFLGYKDFDELMRLYAQSDCLLFPSIFDTDGLVVKEANKCGCPALVIDNTGASEQIENNINGFALPNDVIAFADKIEELYRLKKTNKEEYLALRERTLNKKVPSWEEVANRYHMLYNKISK